MSHIMSRPVGHVRWQWSLWAVRAATAAGLAIDAYVHLDPSAPSPTCMTRSGSRRRLPAKTWPTATVTRRKGNAATGGTGT
jgi:hypothetical protein